MAALVVYESMYGSTQAIAEAIAEGINPASPVRVIEVGALAAEPGGSAISGDVDLLVVGGPTHAFGMSRPNTRLDAAKDAPSGSVISSGIGIREWLDGVALPVDGTRFATFDTKTVVKVKLPGSAAKAAHKHLRGIGGRPAADPKTFWVHGKSDGPVEGQLEAARAWGAELASGLVRV